MPTCREFYLDDLMAITAIPISDYNLGTNAWQLETVIPANEFNPLFTNAVVIGQKPATPDGMLIPIIRFTGKAKDDENDATAGRSHNVTVTCQVDDRESIVWPYMLILERTPSHLLLTFRDGSKAFVAATQDSYVCTKERDGAKTNITFKIHDLMGIQLMVSAAN